MIKYILPACAAVSIFLDPWAGAFAKAIVSRCCRSTIPTKTLYADQFAGRDAGARMNACLAALPAVGGICDARNITGSQEAAATIVVRPNTTLLLGKMNPLNLRGSPGFSYGSGSQILGAGQYTGTGVFINVYGTPGIASATPAAATLFFHLKDLTFYLIGNNAVGIQLTQTSFGAFKEVSIYNGDTYTGQKGFALDGAGVCSCYNLFENTYLYGLATAWSFGNAANENKVLGGENQTNGVNFEFANGSNHNVLIGVSMENTKTNDVLFDAATDGNVFFFSAHGGELKYRHKQYGY